MELSRLIPVSGTYPILDKSYVVYLELYVVPIGHRFSLVNVEKDVAPCIFSRGHPVYSACHA